MIALVFSSNQCLTEMLELLLFTFCISRIVFESSFEMTVYRCFVCFERALFCATCYCHLLFADKNDSEDLHFPLAVNVETL